MSQQSVELAADKASSLLMAGLEDLPLTQYAAVNNKLRQAYLLGRFEQAAQNMETVIAHCRKNSNSEAA